MLIPVSGLLLLFTEKMLLKVGIDEVVAGHAQTYLIYVMPGLWAMVLLDAARRFF